ncbi:MAG TPA: ATP-dependent DNA helicase PcrA [Synergistetes bacterium]|nr:ATP-dependent DNA helicase PcrA [Synergistota bacterium]
MTVSKETVLSGPLNETQAEAVRECSGPLLVLAGAGSGKTRVLTHKFAWLVSEEGLEPSSILAVTFTNKAAREMQERVCKLLGTGIRGMDIGTFHSYGLRFLIRHSKELESVARRKMSTIFDRSDTRSLVKTIMKDLDLDQKRFEPGWVLESISRAKTECDYRSLSPRPLDFPLDRIFPRYQEGLAKQKAVDFDDLILLPIHLLLSDGELLEAERERFRWILVDEYQDVNRSQYTLLKLLSGKDPRIMVVGDPDQSIYGWRGADMNMILNFEKDFPKAKVVVLEQNYRSTGNILGAANGIIRNNSKRKPKKLWTSRGHGEKIRVLLGRNEREEAIFVASEIMRLRSQGYGFGDVAILYRINAMSRLYEEALLQNDIPYRIVRGTAFYERREVKDAIGFMRLAVNPMDFAALERVANVPSRGLGKKSLERLMDHIAGGSLPAYDTWKEIASGGTGLASKAAVGAVELATHMIRILAVQNDIGAVVNYIMQDIGYGDELSKIDPEGWRDRYENVMELLSVTESGEGLETMLAEIALVTDQDLKEDDSEKVSLMSLHAAKGLEFPSVFLVGLEEAVFPHYRCMDDPETLEEERRLCYVGMTRAEERLYMTAARSRVLFGNVLRNGFSRFLWEIPDEFKDTEDRGEEGIPHACGRPDWRRWGR